MKRRQVPLQMKGTSMPQPTQSRAELGDPLGASWCVRATGMSGGAVSTRVAAASGGSAVSCGSLSGSNLTCRGRYVAVGAGAGAGAGALQTMRGTAPPWRVHTKKRCVMRAQPGSHRQRSCAMWQQGHAGRTPSLPTIGTAWRRDHHAYAISPQRPPCPRVNGIAWTAYLRSFVPSADSAAAPSG